MSFLSAPVLPDSAPVLPDSDPVLSGSALSRSASRDSLSSDSSLSSCLSVSFFSSSLSSTTSAARGTLTSAPGSFLAGLTESAGSMEKGRSDHMMVLLQLLGEGTKKILDWGFQETAGSIARKTNGRGDCDDLNLLLVCDLCVPDLPETGARNDPGIDHLSMLSRLTPGKLLISKAALQWWKHVARTLKRALRRAALERSGTNQRMTARRMKGARLSSNRRSSCICPFPS